MDEHEYQQRVLELGDLAATMLDNELMAAYDGTDGNPDNPEFLAYASELERRGLDI